MTILRNFLFFSTLFLSPLVSVMASSFSAPYELGGIYKFNSTIEKLQAKRVVPVYAFTQEGRRKLSDLKSRGYQCKALPRQSYRCVLFDQSIAIAPSVLKRAVASYQNEAIFISPDQVNPKIQSEGESVIVYRFFKTVAINDIEYGYFDYQISRGQNGEVHKLKLGEGQRSREFVIANKNEIQRILLLADQEKTYFDQFVLSGSFTN